MKGKKMTPNQGIILLGIFLIIAGFIMAGINYADTNEISSAVGWLVVALMGLVMTYIGKKVEF